MIVLIVVVLLRTMKQPRRDLLVSQLEPSPFSGECVVYP